MTLKAYGAWRTVLNCSLCQSISWCMITMHRSKSEDVKAVVPQFDANFEDKLKELKQQGSQKLSVSFPMSMIWMISQRCSTLQIPLYRPWTQQMSSMLFNLLLRR